MYYGGGLVGANFHSFHRDMCLLCNNPSLEAAPLTPPDPPTTPSSTSHLATPQIRVVKAFRHSADGGQQAANGNLQVVCQTDL